ncbi:hypothetical protein HW561_15500 [Rhodobacteraceae bacterium B1Z28]|uniref:Uncharacterized protein n=1 Tax=Ruegeria haliotis TaxID=2747601 RepID=A0ABX2PT29_9RHOB|nr:hypothetical protein [Ruegeria haliotis]NVO57198.1 hypothetical protein [Ruegeria haliotis]
MSKGGYNGGSTILHPGSDWFSQPKGKSKKKKPASKGLKLTPEQKEAQLQYRIRLAAERLAKTQADFDAGGLKPSEISLGKKPSKKRRQAKKKNRSKK